jgi:hypothetical protein
VPTKEWLDDPVPRPEPAVPASRATDDAYLQWRVLMDALGDG